MIVTLTLNTAIDKAYTLSNTLQHGELNRVLTVQNTAGGKGLNAARAVHAAGQEVCATGFVGGHNGAYLCELLNNDGIAHRFVTTAQETRSCINVLDADGTSTEFTEPGPALLPADYEALFSVFDELVRKANVVCLCGSLPKGASLSLYANLIEHAQAAGCQTILDTSGEALVKGAAACPTVVKPNQDEIAQILGHKVTNKDEVIAAARELHNTGIAYVIVSLGKGGSVMACDEGLFVGEAAHIEVTNPVGAGDTLVGSFAVGLEMKLSAQENLRRAMACASANCLSPKTGSYETAVADRLYEETYVEAIG